MSESKSTPNSAKLANILLGLKDKEDQSGLCNLQTSSSQLWAESYGMTSADAIQNVIDSFDPSQQQNICNCRKSKCLKLYCQCFAAKAVCNPLCRCTSCENQPDNTAAREAAVMAILERNPNAFESKYRPTNTVPTASLLTTGAGEIESLPGAGAVGDGVVPASGGVVPMSMSMVAHKNGCRCRKSLCLKKYCECFQGGVPCSAICTCLNCHNTNGPVPSVDILPTAQQLPAVEGVGATDPADSQLFVDAATKPKSAKSQKHAIKQYPKQRTEAQQQEASVPLSDESGSDLESLHAFMKTFNTAAGPTSSSSSSSSSSAGSNEMAAGSAAPTSEEIAEYDATRAGPGEEGRVGTQRQPLGVSLNPASSEVGAQPSSDVTHHQHSSSSSVNGGREEGDYSSSSSSSKPPLVPSHKRKRDPSASIDMLTQAAKIPASHPLAPVASYTSASPPAHSAAAIQVNVAAGGTAAAAITTTTTTPYTPSTATPEPQMLLPSNMSREHQQQLLEQLLYQELQHEGILTSPFTSFLNHNCPSLVQGSSAFNQASMVTATAATAAAVGEGEGSTVVDASNTSTSASTPDLLADKQAAFSRYINSSSCSSGSSGSSGLAASAGAGAGGAADRGVAAVRAASPNSISIATALALLAANAQAQMQQQQSSSSAGAGASTPTPTYGIAAAAAGALAAAARNNAAAAASKASNMTTIPTTTTTAAATDTHTAAASRERHEGEAGVNASAGSVSAEAGLLPNPYTITTQPPHPATTTVTAAAAASSSTSTSFLSNGSNAEDNAMMRFTPIPLPRSTLGPAGTGAVGDPSLSITCNVFEIQPLQQEQQQQQQQQQQGLTTGPPSTGMSSQHGGLTDSEEGSSSVDSTRTSGSHFNDVDGGVAAAVMSRDDDTKKAAMAAMLIVDAAGEEEDEEKCVGKASKSETAHTSSDSDSSGSHQDFNKEFQKQMHRAEAEAAAAALAKVAAATVH